MCDKIKPSFIPRSSSACDPLPGQTHKHADRREEPRTKLLTVSNLKHDDVFNDVFGKSSRSITNYMLDHPGETFDVTPFINGRCKTPVSEMQAAVDGAIFSEQSIKLRQCLAHIDELEAHRKEIAQEILLLAEPFSAALDLLYTLSGLNKNPMTAIAILFEISPDLSVFASSKNLVPGLVVVHVTTRVTVKSNPHEFLVLVLI